MEKLIETENVPLRYALGKFLGTPEELLYELCRFIQKEERSSLEFNLAEATNKTSVRLTDTVENDLDKLIELGYVEKLKYKKYKILKSLWT